MNGEIVFDIETQNTFADVGNDIKGLKVSAVVIYSYSTGEYKSFTESQLPELWPILEKADRLIGYNSLHFDIPVLHNYYAGDLLKIPHLDMMVSVKDALGHRLKLNDIAQASVNAKKSADGLQAVEWWKQGNMEDIIKYCTDDVRITKEVYEFGLKNRQLFYKKLDGTIAPFSVNFDAAPKNENNGGIKQAGINLSLPF